MIYIYAFIGCCISSHAAVVFERLERAEDFVSLPSRCQNCQQPIAWFDLIPIISFVLLRGRCRNCHAQIPGALFMTELCGGLIGTLFYILELPITTQLGYGTLLFFVGIAALQDRRQQEFDLNLLLAPLAVGMVRLFTNPPDQIILLFGTVTALALGWLVFKKQLGVGDLLVYFIMGLVTDFPVANRVLLLASVIVIATNIPLLVKPTTKRAQRVAFIPALFHGLVLHLIIRAIIISI